MCVLRLHVPRRPSWRVGVGVRSRGRGQLWGTGSRTIGPAGPFHGESRPAGLEGLPLPGICKPVPGQHHRGCLGPNHPFRGLLLPTHDHPTSMFVPQLSAKVKNLRGLGVKFLRRGSALHCPLACSNGGRSLGCWGRTTAILRWPGDPENGVFRVQCRVTDTECLEVGVVGRDGRRQGSERVVHLPSRPGAGRGQSPAMGDEEGKSKVKGF